MEAEAVKPNQRQTEGFMTGNEVIWQEAALAAGADIMYGYPITPSGQSYALLDKVGISIIRNSYRLKMNSHRITTISGVL